MASRDRSSEAAFAKASSYEGAAATGHVCPLERIAQGPSIRDLFARRVRDHPAQEALILPGSWLTFADLDKESNRVAWYLAGRGIGAGDIVALGCAAGRDLVVCLLGVIKAGACYMPLDPAYPLQRLRDMLQDAKPDLILAERAVAPVLEAAGLTEKAVFLDSGALQRALAAQKVTAPDEETFVRPPSDDDPAYLVYTSGSTGRPKGVLGRQRALANRLLWIAEALPFAPGERTLFKTSLNFIDGSTELLGALTNGCAVVIAEGQIAGDPRRLAKTVASSAITRLTVVPSQLASLLEAECVNDLVGCRTWVSSGEPLPSSLMQAFAQKLPGARLFNFYGASEAAGDSLWARCVAGETVAIGKPVRNTGIHLLDDRLRPVPDGDKGELYISGAGLALGYHRQADRTAERFVASPFGPPGSVLYRTGDVARRLPDGTIEYLGRSDHQVKIRGVRVEPGEVAAALDSLPAVARSAVVSKKRASGEIFLAAYVVFEKDADRDPGKLLKALAEKLPAAYLPSAIVPLAALPLTPNGKLDRAALPDLETAGTGPMPEAAPETEVEAAICEFFAQVLGVETVSRDDNFFLLGGHSLLAARLAYRLRDKLGVLVEPISIFEAPTPAKLAAYVAVAGASKGGFKPVPLPEKVPLSPAQERLWFLNRLHPDDVSYTLAYAFRLKGRLDPEAFRKAWRDVIDRHEILRTVYPEDDTGKPYQEILRQGAEADIPLEGVTGSGRIQVDLHRLASRPFDLRKDMPLRVHLLSEENGAESRSHMMQLVCHHIALDGGAVRRLLADFETAFVARSAGRVPRWEARSARYAEFAVWQRDGQERDAAGQMSAYLTEWKTELEGAPECLDLPCAEGRRRSGYWDGDSVPLDIPENLHARLDEFARENRSSLFMVLQAALAATLYRLGAGEDIVIGTPVDGRPDRCFEETVGLFVNMLALRSDLSGQPSFLDLLEATRARNLKAYRRRDVPFELVVDAVSPNRDLSFHPLFQLVLALDMEGELRLTLPGLTCVAEDLPAMASKFDLSFDLTVHRGEDGLPSGVRGQIEFRTDLLGQQVAQTIAERFVAMLEAVTVEPDCRIDDLSIVGASEANRLAGLCEGKLVSRPELGTSLVDRFRLLAMQQGDHAALHSETTALSYAALDVQSDRVARNLVSRGVGPGARVAVFMERTVDLVIATLAIVKAGGAYVPLNRNDPPQRLAQLVDDTRAALVLIDGGAEDPAHIGSVPCTAFADLRADLEDVPLPAVRADQIACVLFTSGSTGRPKGIAITHRNIQALALDGCWPDGSHQRVLLHSPYAFDASTYEIWTPLMLGQELFVAPPGLLDAETIARLIENHGITAACITTRLFNIISGEKPEAFRPLKSVLIGGEAASAEALRRATAAAPDTRFVNGYGPAEGTTFVTWHAMRSLDSNAHKVPIGLPRDNCAVRILDDRLRPVGIGMVGELYLAGECLTLGYLDRAGLTAERFVSDPFGEPGTRMYRTGDLVRWRSDGLLVFVGRADHQVKINGFRIEPQEIENVIGRRNDVGQCAVIVREDRPGEKKLVAYIVGTAGAVPDLTRLRKHLTETLPAFMVPAHCVVLEKLPFTTNGKLDLKSLPLPEIRSAQTKQPASKTEADLCRLYADVLGLKNVAPGDNFFALGGDSILSIQLVSRARRAGLVFSARDVFNAKTPAELAAVAVVRHGQEAETELVPGWLGDSDLAHVKSTYGARLETVWPLTGLQSGLLFHGLMDAETGEDAYLVQTVVDLDGEVYVDRLKGSLKALVARHAPLRAVFCHEGVSDPVQVILKDAVLPFEVVDLVDAEDPEGALETLLTEDRRQRFDLATGPLLRACLVRLAGDCSKLILTNHHILLDGWSLPVLMRELKEIFKAGATGTLPPVVPFDRYLGWQQRQDRDAARQAWEKALAGLEEPTRLAAAVHGQPADTSGDVLRFDAFLSAGETRSLEALARRLDITLNTVLQGAWAILLGRICGSQDLVFGATVSGRPPEIAGVETMTGLFINTVPVRARPEPRLTVEAFLKELQGEQAALLPHQHLGLPEIQAGAGLGDLFDTLMVFENYPDVEDMGASGETGLGIKGLEVRDRTHYPASLMVVPGERLLLRLDCRAERIGAELGRSLLDQLGHLLRQMSDQPGAALGALETLAPEQRKAVQDRWNETDHSLPEGDLVDLIAVTASRHADREAVVGGGERLTYAQLEERTNRLAHLLLQRGIGAEDLVAIALPRSVEMVVALLAVLKTGGAYLPLDPDYPPARIAMMLDDAAPKLVLTASGLTEGLQGCDLLVMDAAETEAELAKASTKAPEDRDRKQPIDPRHPAYAIYTSGSTGKPKGVVVTRQGLSNLLCGLSCDLGLTHQDRMLSATTIGFDIAGLELFGPLLAGATLLLFEGNQRESDCLADWIALEKPTVMQATPSLWRGLLMSGPLPELRVLVGGEALDAGLAAELLKVGPVNNLYGPTETTIWSLREPLAQDPASGPGIGLPVWNTRAYVLDEALKPVARGVAGELYIGGLGLARGYHGRPDLTGERFVADPFAGGGARMYRTGDIVYRKPDGSLAFLGRGDGQVKIRGHRIETGEIEAALVAMTNVARAAVIVRPGWGEGPSLVAYVVAQTGADLQPGPMRILLQQNLPDHMVPADIVVLPDLPLTPNGKLNRLALPDPVRGAASSAPRTLQETLLCNLFAEVLPDAMPGPDDNFFEMGGHSLLATRLKMLLKERMGLEVSLRKIFETPTVRGLLSSDGGRKTGLLDPVLQIRAAGRQAPLICVHPGFGLGWTYAGLVSVLPADVPIIALQALGYAGEARLPGTLGEMATDYVACVEKFVPEGPIRLLGWSFGGLAAFEMARLFEAGGRKVEFLTLLDSYPMAAGDPLPDLSDRGARGAFFEMVGFDPGGRDPDDISFEEIGRFLKAGGHPLADLQPADFGNMLRIARNNARLAHGYRPGRLTCPLLHFVSRQSWRMMSLQADPWQALTSGRFDTHVLDCTHHEMTSQAALAEIGKSLADWMNPSDQPAGQDVPEGRLKNVG
ncbi:non-ribosomal peptide synthetase [Roseibium sediminicola]|uniref:Amino acid adenylation domain-containing protein n=1 Tax=Roseibium sediminicola TaxID=2933272 RepID=A0ABT0H0V8_9HYPH|nr:non-ribosomal peptide synthetase [Roseibium sp. CAU 1639]MCK7615319.1 amino acid adenylation domain-containing protein [Roseibium sp. CAU 1639]